LDIIIPKREDRSQTPPTLAEKVFSICLLAVFTALEYRRFPTFWKGHQGVDSIYGYFLPWLGLFVGITFPIAMAAIAIIGSWRGKIPSGLSLIEQLFLRGLGGKVDDWRDEFRDEDAVSYYFAVVLYFALACGALYVF